MDTDDLLEAVEELVERSGLLLVDLSVTETGRSRMVRLLVDRPGRVGVLECAELSRAVKDFIDGELDSDAGGYRLEVSSPGIGRRLSEEVDWIRSVGRRLSVQLEDGQFTDLLMEYAEGRLTFEEGRIVAAREIVSAVEVLD